MYFTYIAFSDTFPSSQWCHCIECHCIHYVLYPYKNLFCMVKILFRKPALPSSSAMSEEQAFRVDRELRSCPADSVDLGASTWKLLHTMSVNFPERPTERERADVEQFVALFGRLYPCRPCAEASS